MNKNLKSALKDRESPVRDILAGSNGQASNEEDWQKAQRRVLCYLQMLEIPALETLELGIAALRRAKEEVMQGGSNPTAQAMRALRKVLSEQGHMSSPGIPSAEDVRKHWFGRQDPGPVGIRSMPPLNRGFITPREGR